MYTDDPHEPYTILYTMSEYYWRCSSHGTTQQFTAPYSSAQNGLVERQHLTIFNKGRMMKISCNAPDYLWDKFTATANYLHLLTVTSTNRSKTPFELWTGHRPNVSHLWEIGCKAFVLVETNNSKIHPQSFECILIGYEPNSKAYRLWH